jgi:hypothetical protein
MKTKTLLGHNRDIVRTVIEQVEVLVNSAEDEQPESMSYSSLRLLQQPASISIWGDRGTGKSIVLYGIIEELRARPQEFLVLDPLLPDFFTKTDNLISQFLAALWNSIKSLPVNENPDATFTSSVLAKLQECIFITAISEANTDVLSSASESLTAFGQQLQTVSASNQIVWKTVCETIVAIRTYFGNNLTVVLPIDDADLSPWDKADVFRYLRFLSTIPGLILITAARYDSFFGALSAGESDTKDSNASLHSNHIDESDESRMSFILQIKVFPLWSRHFTSNLEKHDREVYKGTDSIAKLSKRVGKHLVPQCPNLLYDAMCSTSLLNNISPLPRVTRVLDQLWQYLLTIDKNKDRPLTSNEVTTHLYKVANILISIVSVPKGVRSTLRLELGAYKNSKKPRGFNLDFSSLNPIVSTEAWENWETDRIINTEGSDISVALRPVTKLSAYWDKQKDFVSKYFQRNASDEDIAACLAAQEIMTEPKLFKSMTILSRVSGFDYDGMQFLQRLLIDGIEPEDELALISLPTPRSWSDYCRTIKAWNGIAERLKRESLSLQELLALTIEAAIAAAQHKDISVDKLGTGYGKALKKLDRLVRNEIESEDHWINDIVDWYLSLLPLHWHTAFFAKDKIKGYAEMWLSTADLYPDFSVTSSRSFYSIVRKKLRDVASDEVAAKYSRLAGYKYLLKDVLNLSLPEKAIERLGKSWSRTKIQKELGSFVSDELMGNSSNEKDDFAEGLMDHALLAIAEWEQRELRE